MFLNCLPKPSAPVNRVQENEVMTSASKDCSLSLSLTTLLGCSLELLLESEASFCQTVVLDIEPMITYSY